MFYCSTMIVPLFHHQMLHCSTISVPMFHHRCSTVPPSDVALFYYRYSTVPPWLLHFSSIRFSTVPSKDVLLFHHLCSTILQSDVPLFHHEMFYCFFFHLLFQITTITIIITKHTCTNLLHTWAILQLPHKVMPTVILQVLFKKEQTNHFFQKRKNYLDYKVHWSINFCKFLFLVQIYFSISYLPFILTIKLFMVGSSSFLLQLHKYIFPMSIR